MSLHTVGDQKIKYKAAIVIHKLTILPQITKIKVCPMVIAVAKTPILQSHNPSIHLHYIRF